MKFKISKEKTILIIIFSIFAIIYCLISLVNHYQLRTYALDLGMFNNAVYHISKFTQPIFTLDIKANETHYLATHFSLITYLYFPLIYIFGSYSLLLLQIVSILSGGVAAYLYAKLKFKNNSIIPIIILIHFFCIWGIYSALSFDFHNNVIGAMLMIWFIYFLEIRKLLTAGVFLALAVFSQESTAIWAIFVLGGMMIKNRMEFSKEYIKFEIPAIIICLIYSVLVIGVIMPFIQNGQNNLQLNRYANLGNSISQIMLKIIQDPKYIFSLLFESPLDDKSYFGIKSELHFMVLVSGGFALFYRPYYLFMLIPIYAEKLLSSDHGVWGINSQYAIEFVPILSLSLTDFLLKIKSTNVACRIAIITTISTLFFTNQTIASKRNQWYDKTNTAFYLKMHYDSPFNLSEIHQTLKSIPEEAIVSASSPLTPHLASREKIYQFPIVKDAGYIVLLLSKTNTYPISQEDFLKQMNEYLSNDKFVVQYRNNDLLILKKKQ